MKIIRAVSIVMAAAGLLPGAGAVPAHAEDDPHPPGRTEQGLFGSPNPGHQVPNASITTTLRESYDGNILGDQAGVGADPRARIGGLLSALDTVLSYDRHRDRKTLSFELASTARYYPTFDRVHPGAQSVRLESGQPLWRSARLIATGNALYSPRFGVDPGSTAGLPLSFSPGLDGDSMALALWQYRAGLAGAIEQNLGEVTVLSFSSNLRASQVEGQRDLMEGTGAGASLRRQSGRHSTWSANYVWEQTQRGASSEWISQEATVGFDRRVPLSASRQATYSISAGATMLGDQFQAPRYRMMGDARASYDFGRSWNGGIHYRRGVGFVDPLPDPLVFDSLTFELAGLTTRWMEWVASGSFQHGGIGLSAPSNGYDMYAARTRLTVSLSRAVAVYGEYFLYQYQFGEGVRLPTGVGRTFDRQGASIGLRLHAFF